MCCKKKTVCLNECLDIPFFLFIFVCMKKAKTFALASFGHEIP